MSITPIKSALYEYKLIYLRAKMRIIENIQNMVEYQSPKSEEISMSDMEILCLSNGYGGNVDDLDREDIENW